MITASCNNCAYYHVEAYEYPCNKCFYLENWKEKTTDTPIDVVNHPVHYTQGGIECIDAMKAAFGADELKIYCKIAAFKYLWRMAHKNGLEDMKKAQWYLTKFIELDGEIHDTMRDHN